MPTNGRQGSAHWYSPLPSRSPWGQQRRQSDAGQKALLTLVNNSAPKKELLLKHEEHLKKNRHSAPLFTGDWVSKWLNGWREVSPRRLDPQVRKCVLYHHSETRVLQGSGVHRGELMGSRPPLPGGWRANRKPGLPIRLGLMPVVTRVTRLCQVTAHSR